MQTQISANVHTGRIYDSAPAVNNDVLDFEVLKGFEKVKSDDGSDILIELIDLYLQSTARAIHTMQTAAAANDWNVVKRAAHTVKGTSSTLGLHRIAKTCREIESASSSATNQIDALMGQLELRFREAESALATERDRRARNWVIST
jgi:HPt (histidine-containing phosphotransfer) domain-containing protein